MGERTKSENTLSKFNLLVLFEQLISKSGFLLVNYKDINDKLENFHSLVIEKDKRRFEIIFNIRNISDAYLPNRPEIKRRQVGKLVFDELPSNQKNRAVMLLGLKIINSEPVLVCWNPFYFVGHATNRSCYVAQSSMEKALQCGLYVGEDCKTRVYACFGSNFNRLLKLFVEENALEQYE